VKIKNQPEPLRSLDLSAATPVIPEKSFNGPERLDSLSKINGPKPQVNTFFGNLWIKISHKWDFLLGLLLPHH
jgi:hypothetical protein